MRRKKKSPYAVRRDRAFKLAKIRKAGKPLTGEDAAIAEEHAMKVDLGFFHYRNFYFDILLKAIADLELTVGEKRTLNQLLDEDRFAIETIEERIVDESCKHSRSDNGALYRVSVKIPGRGVVPKSRFFVKMCVSPERWEKSLIVEGFLASQDISKPLVPAVKYSDRKARILAYEFVDGQPLYELFKEPSPEEIMGGKKRLSLDEKEQILRRTIESLFTLSYDATSMLSASRQWPNGTAAPLAELTTRSGNPVLAKQNNHGEDLFRDFVVKGNPSLEDRLTAWDGKISKKDKEWVKRKYKSVQPLLDAYKPIAGLLDSQELWFSHGDIHFGNILWTRSHKPKFIDWEDAVLPPRPLDLVRILKKAGIPEDMEQRLVDYAFVVHKTAGLRCRIVHEGKNTIHHLGEDGQFITEKGSAVYERQLEEKCSQLLSSAEGQEGLAEFRKAYDAMHFHRNLVCAAKYLNYADKSKTPEHRRMQREMANYYYTLALNYVRGEELEKRIKDVVEEVMDGMLIDLGERISEAPTPLARRSFSNWGHKSVIDEMEGRVPKKKVAKRAALHCAASAAAAAVIVLGAHTHIETRASENFLESLGNVPGRIQQTPHSAHVEKYSQMYSLNPLMLEAAVSYVVMNSTKLDLGPAAKYRNDPEQLTMSIAKKMHDAIERHGENYPVVLADVFAGSRAVEASKRMGITGRYVDFRRIEPKHAKKVADTMALSGYYAKQRQRKMNPRWQR